MNEAKKPFRLNKIVLLLILGLVSFIVYFVLFVNPASFIEVISHTDLTYYACAFVVYLSGVFFSSLVWFSLLNNLTVKTTVKSAFLFTLVGLFFDATIPQLGLSGDLAKTYFFSKASSENPGRIGASVIGQKIIVMTITVVSFSAGLILVLLNYAMPTLVMVLVVAFLFLSILSLFIIYYVSIKPKATQALLRLSIKVALIFRSRWNPEGFSQKAQETLEKFHDGMLQLKAKPKALLQPVFYSILSWILDIAVVFLAFTALGYPVPVDTVLIVYTVTGALQAVGLAIFGINEIIMSTSFVVLGIPSALSISVTLLTRAVTLWFRLIMAYGALQWTGIRLVREKKTTTTS
jgi:uncharacterized protein (TIRG00374 family)